MMMSKRIRIATVSLLFLFACAVAFAESAGHGGGHGGGHHETNWVYVISLWFNFLGLMGILFFVLKKPVAGFFATRSDEISKQLNAAANARKAAEAKITEYGKKLDDLVATRDDVLAKAKEEAAMEKERILKTARKQAESLLGEAEKSLDVEVAKAKRLLIAEVNAEIMIEAERLIRERMNESDDLRLSDEFIEKLREVKGA